MTSLLSRCFLWSSWIWLYHHSCYYNFAESLLPLLIMNLIKLLFTSLHYYWVIAISENQEFDYVIIHVIALLLSHYYLWWSLQCPAGEERVVIIIMLSHYCYCRVISHYYFCWSWSGIWLYSHSDDHYNAMPGRGGAGCGRD